MKRSFKFSIPKPCHEDWDSMTQNEKGRFCDSCSKTVVDFTEKSTIQIQEILREQNKQSVCGHFHRNQLDVITIEIPQVIFKQQLSFRKLFILSAILTMGTSLFNCTYTNVKKQKIENIIVIDSFAKIKNDDYKNDSINEVDGELDFIEIPITGGIDRSEESEGVVLFEEFLEDDEILE